MTRLILAALALLLATTATGELSLTAKNSGYYRLNVDGVEVSKHTAEREAIESGTNIAKACPDCLVSYVHTYLVDLEWTPDVVIEPPPIDPPIEPPPEQDPVAMYAYTLTAEGELENPLPLEGATLERRPTFLAMTGGWKSATYYCCKSASEPHRSGVSDNEWPLVLQVDTSTLHDAPGERRELYVDLTRVDDTVRSNNFAYFYIEAAPEPPPIDPPIDPPVVDPDGVTMHWTIPDEREDGTPLAVTEVSHYVIAYWKDMGDVKYVDVEPGSISNFDIDLPNGAWTFQIKAVDNTPDIACSDPLPEDYEPYSCGGPLESQWSGQVTANLAEALPE
jgi:hypothetical protein